METKICPFCKSDLPISCYYMRKTGELIPRCKTCKKTQAKAVPKHITKIYKAAHRNRNSEELNRRSREYHSQPANKARRVANLRCRLARDPEFKLITSLRRSFAGAVRNNAKASSIIDLIGCSISELKRHIEAQFAEGMTWENWGRGQGKWQIDHNIPVSYFDHSDENQQRACWHFTNMQPLWAIDNIRKRNKLPEGMCGV